MSLAKKGNRLIAVDGDWYRWAVTGRREPTPGFVVELADAPACRLFAVVTAFAVVTPGLVAEGVRIARAAGWDPHQQAPDFRLPEPLWGAPIRTP